MLNDSVSHPFTCPFVPLQLSDGDYNMALAGQVDEMSPGMTWAFTVSICMRCLLEILFSHLCDVIASWEEFCKLYVSSDVA